MQTRIEDCGLMIEDGDRGILNPQSSILNPGEGGRA